MIFNLIKLNKVTKSLVLLVFSFIALFSLTNLFNTKPVKAAYIFPDTSVWQGNFTATKVRALKKEVPFIFIRAQYGSASEDSVFIHNATLLKKYGVPFGVYSFSMYTSPRDAKNEAKVLYERTHSYDPIAYINDFESLNLPSSEANKATADWYKEMNTLTNKPIVFYSYRSFQQSYAPTAYAKYSDYWLAAYTSVTPTPANYSAWQYSDAHYFSALGMSTDASRVMTNKRSLSYWLGSTTANKRANTYINGGFKVKDKVVLNKTAKAYYNPSGQSINDSIKGHEYTIKEVQSVNSSTSNQAVLLVNKSNQSIGWVLAQDIHYPNSYISMPKGHTLVSLTKLNEYKDKNFANKSGKSLAKNTVFHVKGVVKSNGGATRFILNNGNYVSGNAKNVKTTSPYITELNSAKHVKAYTGIKAYKTKNLTGAIKGKGHKKGTVFSVKKIVARSNNKNHYSLKLSNGYYATSYRANVRNTTKALSSTTKTYTIKSGDSLWGIAYNHGISLTKLESLNGLSNNSVIYPGQQLKLS